MTIGLLGFVVQRADLRLHRKIVVVDERIAYTGSMNLVDPRFFKQGAGVGEWIDAMVRIAGPAVAALRTVFLFDWNLQTGEPFVASSEAALAERRAVGGAALVQVVPSGPGVDGLANLRILVDAVAIARQRIVLTTPYFVPDPALALGLQNAAMRGVEVTIILPAVNDSKLVTYASRAFYPMWTQNLNFIIIKRGKDLDYLEGLNPEQKAAVQQINRHGNDHCRCGIGQNTGNYLSCGAFNS